MKEMEKNESVQMKVASEVKGKEALLDEVMRVEAEAWPEEIRAPREKFVSRMETFPEGFILCYVDGKLAGVSTTEIIDFDPDNPPTSWEETTDNGFIKETHISDGNALYAVSVGVSSWAQGKGLGSRMLSALKDVARKHNLDYLVLGSRLPGYRDFHQENEDVSAKEYARMTNENGEPVDPEIRFYQRNGLEISKVVPNYMEDDPESEDYGAVMVWKNN